MGGEEAIKKDTVEELFEQYYNQLLLYTLSLCGNKPVAEDVVATAFFKALQSVDTNVQQFKPWLLAVCRNEYFSLCRKKKHYATEEVPGDLPDDSPDILDRIIRDEEYRALYRAVSLLPPARKEAITLFYFHGLSVHDIGTIMNKSENNVKVLLHRGRTDLKHILEVTE